MRRLFKLTVFLFLLEIMSISPCAGQPAKITILLIDRLSLEDMHTLAGPFCAEMIRSSALALMTTNTAGARTPGNTHATIAAGAPALSDRPGGLALNFEEEWMGINGGELYRQLSGESSSQAAVFIPQIAEALRLNYSASRTALPTLLGSTLKENNFSSAVLGNADPAPPSAGNIYTPYARFAPWLAADPAGLVERGDIGPQTLQRSNGLIPWESNYRYLFKKYCELRTESDLIILELGDFSRLEALKPYLFDQQVSTEKQRLFSRLEQFLQELWLVPDWEEELLILVSPTPSSAALKTGNTLTPLLFWGKGMKPGFLTSPTTRHPGLVANLDLAPTILQFFGVNIPAYVSGRPITCTATGNLEALLRINQRLVRTSLFRRQTIPLFLNFTALALPLLLALYLILPKLELPASAATYPWWYDSMYFLSILPLSLHLTALFPADSLLVFLTISVGSAAFFTLLCRKLGTKFEVFPLELPFSTMALIILADLLTGNHLVQNSIFGYDPMAGARYYGLGNEGAGLFLGALAALLVLQSPAKSRFRTRFFFAAYLGSALLLATPFTGANFGAALSAVACTLTLSFAGRKSSRPAHQLPRYLFYLTLFALLFLGFDYLRGDLEHQTHFGLLLKNLRARGPSAVTEVVLRKLQVNLRLLSSKWALLFASSLITLLVTYLHRKKHFAHLPLSVALSGGLAGLLLNDSGLVFSALYFYLSATALLLKAATLEP